MVLLLASTANSQDGGGGSQGKDAATEKSFADLVKDSEKTEGFFDVYRNPKSGDLHIGIKPSQLDNEFIHIVSVVDSPVEAGLVRGINTEKMLRIERHFNRVEFISEPTTYYHNPESPLSRASGAHKTPAVLAVAGILAEDEATGTLLIDGRKLFASEALQQIKASPQPDFDPKTAFALGELDGERSKVYESRSYPKNTDWFVDYVYANPAPVVPAKDEVPDSRFVSVRIQHSFVEAPDDGFKPRFDDYRVGYFTSRITDLTSDSVTPFRDVIMRWDLRKSDPDAAVSDVAEPLVWWIENTTPHEWRDIIRDAVLAWNPAFEKAGLRNALEVRVQPDDADWDAGDLRYNVLRWASSPQPPYGGIGPAVFDPRTGQVLGSDIGLEYSYMLRHLDAVDLFDPASLADAFAPPMPPGAPQQFCRLGAGLKLDLMLGRALLESRAASDHLREQLVRDTLLALVLHEVGHTLGLNHNMKATQLLSIDEMNDPAVMESGLLDGSIMDYAPIHFATGGAKQTLFYSVKPGAYDDWAIEFGYSPDLAAPEARAAHLARSTRPELAFGNDADDMRAPGYGIDPRVNIFDHSSDAIEYATQRIGLSRSVLGDALQQLEGDESYQRLVNNYLLVAAQISRSAAVVSRYVGGVHVNRAAPGQAGAGQPYVAVPLAEQQRAMSVLRKEVFAPAAFPAPETLLTHLQPQRRGFDFYGKTEDPKLHELVLTVHKGVLDHLVHPVVLKRMTDSRLYGNEYSVTAMLGDLSDAIFADDLRGPVDTIRQNLQLEYVDRLLAIVESGRAGASTPSPYDVPSRAAAYQQLQAIDGMMAKSRKTNAETSAHREYLRYQIASRLEP
jgi:hypothetical protein